jgi:hypothetical protein
MKFGAVSRHLVGAMVGAANACEECRRVYCECGGGCGEGGTAFKTPRS